MPVDYSALLYDPVYAEIGVPALFATSTTIDVTDAVLNGLITLSDSTVDVGDGTTFTGSVTLNIEITVIDDTRPKVLPAGSVEVRGVGPGAFVRIPELEANGISRDDWQDAVLSFNGRSWTVRSYELRGSPNGEDLGEVRFLLKAVESSDG